MVTLPANGRTYLTNKHVIDILFSTETAVIGRTQESMWCPGFYKLQLLVKDLQGQACPEPQELMVQVCICGNGAEFGKLGVSYQTDRRAKLGPVAIGLLLLGLSLLLSKYDKMGDFIRACAFKDVTPPNMVGTMT